MAISADWIAQNTATTGTGTITLGTALTGFIRLQDDSRITDGALVNYTIEDGNNREMGIGTYTSAGGTLARTVVQRTLVNGTYDDTSPTAISLSGSAVVRCSAVAEDRNFRGALVTKSDSQSLIASSTTTLTWDGEVYDTDGFHDTVTNPSRFTIPPGVSVVRLKGSIFTNALATILTAEFRKNGGPMPGGGGNRASTAQFVTSVSAPVYVTAGDYFELVGYTSSSGITIGTNAHVTNFSIEVIE